MLGGSMANWFLAGTEGQRVRFAPQCDPGARNALLHPVVIDQLQAFIGGCYVPMSIWANPLNKS